MSSWTKADVAKLKSLCSSNTLFMSEIAEKIGKRAAATRWKSKKLGLSSKPVGRFAEWNKKHAHLREEVMTYFLNHTLEETRDAFGLTHSNLKSLFSVAYKDPKYAHLRKDLRRHDAWTVKETLALIRYSGLQPRAWIAKKLNRGTRESVKEMLSRLQCSEARFMNGMPLGWAQVLFGDRILSKMIKTKAGPTGCSGKNKSGDFFYLILPWVECDELIQKGLTRPMPGKGRWKESSVKSVRRLKLSPDLVVGIRGMAKFQRWIHGLKSSRAIRARLEKSTMEK